MRVLHAVVLPAAGDLLVLGAKLLERGPVGPETIRHQFFGSPVPVHQLAQELQGGFLVSPLGDKGLQHFPFAVALLRKPCRIPFQAERASGWA